MLKPENFSERRTKDFVYFVGGPFSQWYPSPFVESLVPEGEMVEFDCAEQYMMARKAFLFGDDETLDQILNSDNPKEQKQLGRKVRNFDPVEWDQHARDAVFRGNWAKFTQNIDLAEYLVDTEGMFLVEGAWYDPVWGVKLAWDDPAIEDINNWQGKNWLGQVLMHVRNHIIALDKTIQQEQGDEIPDNLGDLDEFYDPGWTVDWEPDGVPKNP